MDENRLQVYNPIIPKALRTKSFLIHVVLSVLDLWAPVVSEEHPGAPLEPAGEFPQCSGRVTEVSALLVAELFRLCMRQRTKQKQGALSA